MTEFNVKFNNKSIGKPEITSNGLLFELKSNTSQCNSVKKEIFIRENGFMHLLEGSIIVSTDKKKYQIKENESILLTKGIYYISEYISQKGAFRSTNLFFDNEILNQIRNQLNDFGKCYNETDGYFYDFCIIKEDELISLFFRSLSSIINNPMLDVALYKDLVTVKINELLLILLNSSKNSEILSNVLYTQFIKSENQIHNIITDNVFNNLNISELANRCNMSISTFKRYFSKQYNTTPMQWIYEKRFEKAKYLLQNSQLSITDIAFECGFESYSHFCRRFKIHFGKTAKEIRTQLR